MNEKTKERKKATLKTLEIGNEKKVLIVWTDLT